MMDPYKLLEYGVRIAIIFLILPIHEYAHAWAAKKMGDDTALYQGRLTLNPISHIDPVGAICLLFTGFGWAKPVPINPTRFKKYRKGIALTALAGPLSNLIVAAIGMIIYKVMLYVPVCQEWYFEFITKESNMWYVMIMIQMFIIININLAIFNLIPIPPLDGSKILSYFTSSKFDKFMMENQFYIYIGFLVLLVTGILERPLSFLVDLAYRGLDFITGWIDPIMNLIVK